MRKVDRKQKPLTKEEKQRQKKAKILSTICHECGRERRIPVIYCQQCWQEMKAVL